MVIPVLHSLLQPLFAHDDFIIAVKPDHFDLIHTVVVSDGPIKLNIDKGFVDPEPLKALS